MPAIFINHGSLDSSPPPPKTYKNSFESFGNSGKIFDDPIVNLIDNFYMTDPISRASRTMSMCSLELMNNKKIILE